MFTRYRRTKIIEEIVGNLNEVSGRTYDTVYDLYFTTERLIAVLIQNPGDVMPSNSWFTLFIWSGGARRKEQEQRDEIAAERHRKMRNLSPDQLAKSRRNIPIPYIDILSVEIKRNIFFQYSLSLRTAINGKQRTTNFGLDKSQVKEARELLNKLLPKIFKHK